MGLNETVDITGEQRGTILALLERHLPGTEAWVYGSRVKWTSRPQSDLDLVVFATHEQRRQVDALREAFEESDLPFRIDLFVWDDVPDSFRHQIRADHVALTEVAHRHGSPKSAPDEWAQHQLLDLCDITRGASPRPIHDWIAASGVPWVKIADASATPSRCIEQTREYIRAAGRDKSVTVFPGDLILSNSATPGIPKFMGIEACIHDGWLLLRNFRGLDRLFAYYLLLHERDAIVGKGTGSVFTNLKTDTLKRHGVRVPLPDAQRAIAHVLGTLDDKIELNRRMNATLESMARALFRSWFVDFDPVRAKMEGRDTGLPKEIADLFPGRLVDSELGEIPEGWTVSGLGDMIELAYGKSLKAKSRNAAGGVPVFGSNGQIGWHDEALVARPGIVVGRKGNPGTVTLSPTEFFPIDTTFYVVPKDERDECPYFLFFALQDQDLPSVAADSAVPGLNRNLAYMNKQLRPPTSFVECFNGCVSAMYARRSHAAAESRLLASLRDSLLPKLVSGELRVIGLEPAGGRDDRPASLGTRRT